MSNRFEQGGPGFLDLAVEHLKRPQRFLEDVERLVDWRPIEKILKKKLMHNQDAIGNPAYPPLAMLKVLLLQRWWSLSDQGMDDALTYRISFRRFVGLSFSHDTPDSTTICRFRNHLVPRGLDEKLFGIINQQLEARALIVKQGIIVDASIVESARRPRKVAVVVEMGGDEGETTPATR